MSKTKILICTRLGVLTLRQIAEITGIPNEIIRGRYYKGWRGDRLLEPLGHVAIIRTEYKGQMRTLYEIAEREGIPFTTVADRYRYGDRGDRLGEPLRYKKPEDAVGKKFGMLTVLRVYRNEKGVLYTDCVCDCGNHCTRWYASLQGGTTHSCGCDRGKKCTIHGKSKTREHRIWRKIIERCYNPNSQAYRLYGGRGIKMCDSWHYSFAQFYADMGESPSPKHSIDRIDCNGDYSPENCRWATPQQQARNTNSNVHITYKGETRLMVEWAEILGINSGRIGNARRAGWDMDKYFTAIISLKQKYGHTRFNVRTGREVSPRRKKNDTKIVELSLFPDLMAV